MPFTDVLLDTFFQLIQRLPFRLFCREHGPVNIEGRKPSDTRHDILITSSCLNPSHTLIFSRNGRPPDPCTYNEEFTPIHSGSAP